MIISTGTVTLSREHAQVAAYLLLQRVADYLQPILGTKDAFCLILETKNKIHSEMSLQTMSLVNDINFLHRGWEYVDRIEVGE